MCVVEVCFHNKSDIKSKEVSISGMTSRIEWSKSQIYNPRSVEKSKTKRYVFIGRYTSWIDTVSVYIFVVVLFHHIHTHDTITTRA